jgi:hypothetical protein
MGIDFGCDELLQNPARFVVVGGKEHRGPFVNPAQIPAGV